MRILGISAFYHDAAACIVRDGNVLAAAQEERFSRRRHDASFPRLAIEACLRIANCSIDDIDLVCFYEKPHRKFARILSNAGRQAPSGFGVFNQALDAWTADKLWVDTAIKDAILAMSPSKGFLARWDARVIYAEHHISHAASAFLPSPFKEAAILTVDGVGEWATTMLAKGSIAERGNPIITPLMELHYPHSLGLLYSALTAFLGFKVNSGEYKVMGLAPYGRPLHVDRIRQLISIGADGAFSISSSAFTFMHDVGMYDKKRLTALLRVPERVPDELLTQDHMDLAASLQVVIEDVMLALARKAKQETGANALCLAGGVALNCVANGRLLREGIFKDIWVQPASGDAGGALGVALWAWHCLHEGRRPYVAGQDGMAGALLGPEFNDAEIDGALVSAQLPGETVPANRIATATAAELARGRVVGNFQGRMEFGPRALGARSILADPRSKTAQREVNLKVKFRESFRPFAPAVLRERVREWFELEGMSGAQLGGPDGYDSPYMLLVAPVAASKRLPISADEEQRFGIDLLNVPRSVIPGCTHVDYSARIQTVERTRHPAFHAVISEFDRLTGVPVLLNTSFNVRGEPIVCTPQDAIRCFLGTGIDTLVMGNRLIRREDVPAHLIETARCHRDAFLPD